MADGRLPSPSPSSPLEEGEIVPQRVSFSEMVTGQSSSQQGHPLPKLNNKPQKSSYAYILQAQEHNQSAVSIALGHHQSQPSSEPLTMVEYRDPNTFILKPITQLQGKPAVHFLDSEKEALVEKLNLVLIGKFTHGRPSLSNIKIFFQKFKLQGVINVSLADSKHIYIECSNLSDYYWIWLNLSMKIHGFDMRLFKWGADFSPRIESSIAPVWIRIVGMPLYLFDELSLWQIASAVGKPIRIDSRNLNRSILSFARVCVELDISKQPTDTIWVCIKKENTDIIVERICLQVFYDVLPLYCTACSHIGHGEEMCKRKMGKGAATVNVEPTVPVVATTCSDPPQAVTTVWLPVKKNKSAVILNSENRFGSFNLLGGEASKALGILEVDLACVANEPPNKSEAANVTEIDPLPRKEDEAAQTPAAKQIECKTDLEESAVYDWHLVTGNRNNRNNKVQTACSTSLNNQELQQSNQKSNAKEVVDISTDQITLEAKGQSTCCLTDAILEKRGAAKREIQQGNAQTKGYTQQKQSITDLSKAIQEHSLSSLEVEKEQVATSFKDGILSDQQEIQMTHNPGETNEGKETVIKQTWDEEVEFDIVNHTHKTFNSGLQKEAGHNKHEAMSEQVMEHLDHQGQRTTPELVGIDNPVDTKNGKKSGRSEKTKGTKLALNPKDNPYFSHPPSMVEHNVSNSGQASTLQNDNSMAIVMVENIHCSKEWKRTEDQGEVMMAEKVAKEPQLFQVSRQEDTAETETQLSNIDTSPASNSQIVGSSSKTTTAGKADKEASTEGCYSKAIVGWEEADELGEKAPTDQPVTQDWQVVGKKQCKTKGVVTRSHTKNANSSWTDKIEEEHVVDQSPIPTKVQVGFKASKSRRQLERQMCRLGSRLNNMGSRHVMRSQLEEEMNALQEEYSLL